MTLKEERRLRVFENRVLRSIFGPKRDEVTWEWRKLHNRMWKGEVRTGFCWGDLRERDLWVDPGVDGMIILGWIFKK
jgi:hypothetical protein